MNNNLLQGEKIYLRALEPEDLDNLYKWENDSTLWIHGNTLAPYSKLALRTYLSESLDSDVLQMKQLRLIVCRREDAVAIGTIDLYEIEMKHRRAGVGIFIDESYRRQNHATEVLLLLHDYAFNFLNLHQLYAYVSSENKISLNLFKKQGYLQSGTLKDWVSISDNEYRDVLILQLGSKSPNRL